jgi:multidrug efflux system membrane fusion protein
MKSTHEDTVTRESGDGQPPRARPGREADKEHQAKSPVRRRSILIAALLAAALLVAWLVYHRGHTKNSSGPGAAAARGEAPPVPVVAGVVTTRDVPIYLDGLGTVQAFNAVTVHSRVDGQLVNVAFTEGQDVKTGDILAQIDPAPYQAQFDQTVAKKAQDEAQLANARVDLKRYADLLATESTTQQIYDTQKALIDQVEAAVKADQAAIASAKVQLDYSTIRSPIDGRVGIRQVDMGNIVHTSDANGLVVLSQLRPISVIFTLPEQALPKLQQQAADFPVLAVSRDNTNVLAQGKLAVIDNQIDTTTGTIKLKANFANDNLRLWPGQFVNTRLLLTTRTNSPVVPASVIQRGPEGAFAFVIQDDQTVKMRPVKVAQIESGEALIDEGLRPGEHVVVDGQYKLQAGSHVKPADAPSKGGGPKEEQTNSSGKTNRSRAK